jgi:hypothetical protein
VSDLNEGQSSSQSSEPLLHRRPGLWSTRHVNLAEESDRNLAGFLPAHNSVHNRITNMSTEMHLKSAHPGFQSNLNSNVFQPYIHRPKTIMPLDGAVAFPDNLERLIQEFCAKEKTRNLPCARSLGSRSSKTGTPFWYEDIGTGIVLATSAYKYGYHQFLTVVHGRREPAIINYIQGAVGETSARKLYSVWNCISGWETTPSIAKIFREESTHNSLIPSNPNDIKPSQATTFGSSALGSSLRRAGREAKEKIRLSLKRKRQEYEWEEEAEEDGSGKLSLCSHLMICTHFLRYSCLASSTKSQALQRAASFSAICQLRHVS